MMKAHGHDTAAVIITPVEHDLNIPVKNPEPGYLEEVKNLAEKFGALLIFDEIRTGFRYHIGGAQAWYGVTPHLSTFGKALANGFAISALLGAKEYMQAEFIKSLAKVRGVQIDVPYAESFEIIRWINHL